MARCEVGRIVLALCLLGYGVIASPLVANDSSTTIESTVAVTTADPSKCTSNADCISHGKENKIICDDITKECVCENRTLTKTKYNRCLPMRWIGEKCRSDEQCLKLHQNTLCNDGYCTCKEGYFLFFDYNETSCTEKTEIFTIKPMPADHSSGSMSEKNMVPMVVCLAIMFIGMCVALQLFSRARFRNQRTIFNSPHPRLMHIKLGKHKKRRHSHSSLQIPGSRQPSICSRTSPRPSRSGSKVGSPDFARSSLREHNHPDGPTLLDDDDEFRGKDEPSMKNGPSHTMVENGPNSPKVIITRAEGAGSFGENGNKSPSSPTRV